MPRYDFRCRTCGTTFEESRPMAASGDPATCPGGHRDTVKLMSLVSVGGQAAPEPSGGRSDSGGGGCCGGACGCG